MVVPGRTKPKFIGVLDDHGEVPNLGRSNVSLTG
jgi:hypothetical protein